MRRTFGYFMCVLIAVACNKTSDPGLTTAQQLEKDIMLLDEFLTTNNISTTKLESGIRYVITENSDGPTATKDNCIRFRYTGYELGSPTAFDSNTGDGIKSPLKGLVGGMQIGLKLVPVGAKGTIYMPSVYGYGAGGSRRSDGSYIVNPNAILRFDVEPLELYHYNAEGNYCEQ